MNIYDDINKDFANYLPKAQSDMEKFIDKIKEHRFKFLSTFSGSFHYNVLS